MKIKILVADDHQIVRASIRTFLDSLPDVEVIGEAENGVTAVKLAQELLPDVVIMDIIMPDSDGIDATRHILQSAPRVKVIGLSIHSDKRFIERMFCAGATGYLLKDCAFEELEKAILTVIAGETYLSPALKDGMPNGVPVKPVV